MISNNIEDAKTSGEAAAIWWMNELRTPKYDSGDKNETVDATKVMAIIVASKVDDENLSRFGDLMKKMVDGENDKSYTIITFDVDYHPSSNLLNLAKEAGLKASWPWKTSMRVIGKDEVRVMCGYAAKEETIWRR